MRCLVVGVMSVLMVLSTNCSSNSILSSDNMEWKLSFVFQSIELTPGTTISYYGSRVVPRIAV